LAIAVYGRGTADNKGQHSINFVGPFRAVRESAGRRPARFSMAKFIIENG